MYNISLRILLVMLLITHVSFGCDYKLLETEAQSCNHRLWSSAIIDTNIIKNSLSFLEDIEEVESRYGDINNFLDYSTSLKAQSNNKSFLDFVDKCEEVYRTTEDIIDKAAIYMLAEAVSDKFFKDSKILNKTTQFRQNRSNK